MHQREYCRPMVALLALPAKLRPEALMKSISLGGRGKLGLC